MSFEDVKDVALDQMSKNIDIDPATIETAYAGDPTSLKEAFNITTRESEGVGTGACIATIAVPISAACYASGHEVIGSIALAASIFSAAIYHQASKGVDTVRQTVLTRYSAQQQNTPQPQ